MHGSRRGVALALLALTVLSACGGSSSEEAATPGGDGTGGAGTSVTGSGSTGEDGTTTTTVPLPEDLAGFSSATYADPISWVCRADVDDDACDLDLTSTVRRLDGTSEVVVPEVAPDDAVDCFYVYPTVNFGGSRDDAMAADMSQEVGVVEAQLAQLGQVCRLWAPLYRQVTLSGFGNEEDREVAYGDVRDAFFHWLANDSDGRPFVVVGHSQGTGHLARLLAEEVVDEPAVRGRLVSALLLGGRTDTPTGDPSTSSAGLPLCRSAEDTGCAIAFNTVSPAADPADLARWGGAEEGRQRACTNPADPSAPVDAWVPADSIVPVEADDPTFVGVETPYLALEGAVEVRCTVRDGASVLEARQAEGWTGPALSRLTTDVPGWGLHIIEVNLVEGSLVQLVGTQAEAFHG